MEIARAARRYDVVVVGAGHAGAEAALAAARAGCRTLVLTPNLDRAGYMPCNPSIGGPGKSHLVAEVDALGGEMARAADRAALQVRRLNDGKGPAVQAIRVQADKLLYAAAIKDALERQTNLDLLQDEATGLIVDGGSQDRPRVRGIVARATGDIAAGAVVITAGTFLRACTIAGEERAAAARAGDRPDTWLSASLDRLGFALRRLKTGTPPRVDGRTVDFALAKPEHGSMEPLWMSRDGAEGRVEPLSLPANGIHRQGPSRWRRQLACHRVDTTGATHDLIRSNLHRAPMFNGSIEGIGPRYCPSIEDRVARFEDKASHPVFLEPEGWLTVETYVQGMSTSLPFDVQDAILATIPALRNARITRYGYAVEYDAVDPAELTPTLESRRIGGLFLAGQVNGTSGYEEAAGQGIFAGLNAANLCLGRPAVVFRRDQAYIGVLVDDLVTKPFDEPYRMLTSRAEYRLLLRTLTADRRLAPIAYAHGLIGEGRFREVEAESHSIVSAMAELGQRRIGGDPALAAALSAIGVEESTSAGTALGLLKRPGVRLAVLARVLADTGDDALGGLPPRLHEHVEQEVKYGALIAREEREVQRLRSIGDRPIPSSLDYWALPGLRHEAREKLSALTPRSFGQASRIAGVTPADLAVLLIHAGRLPERAP